MIPTEGTCSECPACCVVRDGETFPSSAVVSHADFFFCRNRVPQNENLVVRVFADYWCFPGRLLIQEMKQEQRISEIREGIREGIKAGCIA